MSENEVERVKKELYRYKTLYKIILEENKLLKENNENMQNVISQFEQEEQKKSQERSIIYRGLRKIYHIVKK
mgnify:CR=1 FL=1